MRSSVAALLAVALGGCVQLTDVDPTGSAASISGRWTIDGLDPSSSGCGLLGSSRVRVTFLDDLRPVTHPGLFFQCRTNRPSGEEPGFDTRDANGAVVAPGCWAARLSALDSGGQVIAVGPLYRFVVPDEELDTAGCPGDVAMEHVELPVADFLSARLIAATELGGSRAGDMACLEADIDEVRLVFDDLGGGRVDALGEIGVTTVTQPCSLGRIAARVLPGFEYVAHLERVDSSGAVTAGPPTTFNVSDRGSDCFFGGSCRAPCRSDEDCQGAGASCESSFCRPASEAELPTVALDGL